jgi:uncharacterized protein (TIGR03083 family)
MRPLAPIYTAHLLAPIHRELVALLHSLDSSQWLSPTSAGQWRVRDVVAHLLDGDLRRLSYHRDGLPQPEIATLGTYNDVLGYLNKLNDTWVAVADRFSPRLLTQLVDGVGRQAVDFLASLPPHEAAHWPVSWAGEGRSENWMDVSRNYTEYWHHQQQIREAVGKPLLNDTRWLQPVIALGVRAIPPALEHSAAGVGAIIHINVTGPAGGRWWLKHEDGDWMLSEKAPAPRTEATATIEVEAEDAARIWYAGRRPQPAAVRARISGDAGLAEAVLMARALMV